MRRWFSCFVKCYDVNSNEIKDVDVLKYNLDKVKLMKKKSHDRAEFSELLRREFMWRYWSKSECELIITKTEDGRTLLSPWCGFRDKEGATIDVTNIESFDWRGFADKHIGEQIYKNEAKIDMYDQIMYGDRFERLVDDLWYTLLPYERDNPKFH